MKSFEVSETKIDFTENLSDRKFHKFPQCENFATLNGHGSRLIVSCLDHKLGVTSGTTTYLCNI